jgi:hypothetical protein
MRQTQATAVAGTLAHGRNLVRRKADQFSHRQPNRAIDGIARDIQGPTVHVRRRGYASQMITDKEPVVRSHRVGERLDWRFVVWRPVRELQQSPLVKQVGEPRDLSGSVR